MLHRQLCLLREKSGLTQKVLSAKLGMARTTYAGYELGTSEPDNETLERIANFHGVSLDFLFGREIRAKAKILIIINELDNAAFENRNEELARILREYADKIERGEQPNNLRDINGNVIGNIKYE